MCDYSLQNIGRDLRRLATNSPHETSVPAHVASLRRKMLGVAVCVLPGNRACVYQPSDTLTVYRFVMGWKVEILSHATAIFRQVNKNEPMQHHDALEFPDGRFVLLTTLSEGQEAMILQLPAQPTTVAEADAQKRVANSG